MHLRTTIRVGVIISAAAATLLAAGCSSAGHFTPLGGTKANGGTQTLAAATLLKNVSGQTAHITSMTGTMLMQSNGAHGFGMQGNFKMRTAPDVAMEMDMRISGAGQELPGTLREIITSSGLYLNMSTLAQITGKPWIGIPISKLDKASGGSLASMLAGIKQQDPLSVARMLAASKDVTSMGTETIDGVPTTHLHGTFSYRQALATLPSQMRTMEQQYAKAMGAGKITFDLWVDAQNLPRQIVETYDMAPLGHVTMTVHFTSFNQPVSITAPPASEVGTPPGVG